MVFPLQGKRLAIGVIIAGVLLLAGAALLFWKTDEGQSRVEGANDQWEEGVGVLQPVTGKLEFKPRGDVATNIREEGELNGEADLAMVDNGEEAGKATRDLKEGRLLIDIAVRLPEAAEGKFYEAWLVMRGPARAYFSLGVLKPGNDGFGWHYEGGQDMPQYEGIVVTEESEDRGRDGIPERLVAEGVFGG